MAIELKDQMGKSVRLESFPKRIISLVPSLTELLYDLGLESEVVGITKFCVHPGRWFRAKTRIGGTKTVDLEKIVRLVPDLVIANKEENLKEQVEEISANHAVYTSNISNITQSLQMIKDIGILTGRSASAENLMQQVQAAFSQIKPIIPPVKACYLIWNEPYITVGGDTYINEMMEKCGLQNVFKQQSRYPETTLEQILELNVSQVLLSSEPFPFKEKHAAAIRNQILRLNNVLSTFSVKVTLVDGEMFSWYGSRMLKAAGYLNSLQNELVL